MKEQKAETYSNQPISLTHLVDSWVSRNESLSAYHHYVANEGTSSARRDEKDSMTVTIDKYYVADSMLRKHTLARAKHRSSPGPSHAYSHESSC